MLLGQSRARKTPSPSTVQIVIDRILEIRDHPPDHWQRTPGPVAILYFLHQDETLKTIGVHLPTSTRTIWRILDRNGRIVRFHPPEHAPVERPAPLVSWQCDFKDVPSVPPEPEGKQQHVVETLNVVDVGTSILVDAHVRSDFTMETVLLALAQTLQTYSIPQSVRIDRDPHFIGSQQGRDFPSPFMRFLLCQHLLNKSSTKSKRQGTRPRSQQTERGFSLGMGHASPASQPREWSANPRSGVIQVDVITTSKR